MKIYRVVNSDGKGFYQSRSDTPPIKYWYPILNSCKDSESLSLLINCVHPTIKIKDEHKNFNFAFETIEDLISWFPLDILHHMNGNIICISIDEQYVIKYNKQVQYNPDFVINTTILDKTKLYEHISYPDDRWWIWRRF